MESTGRSLRSGAAVPALKSPEKGPKQNSGKKPGPRGGKLIRGNGGKFAKNPKIAVAIEEAESFMEESAEEVEEELKQKKRPREDDDEGEMERKISEEAKRLAKKVSDDDKVLKVLESRRSKAVDDVERYKHKAELAKTKLIGKAASKKSKEIKAKLSNLAKRLSVIRDLVVKRKDTIYAAALKEITEAKRPSKKRHVIASTMSEDSEGDALDVSEGEYPFPRSL
jgi:hypothetical protein